MKLFTAIMVCTMPFIHMLLMVVTSVDALPTQLTRRKVARTPFAVALLYMH